MKQINLDKNLDSNDPLIKDDGDYEINLNGYTIDTTGAIVAFWPDGEEQEEVPFNGPVELADVLITQEQISPCFSSYAASYSFGLGNEEVECFVETATHRFADGEIDIVELFTSKTHLSNNPLRALSCGSY